MPDRTAAIAAFLAEAGWSGARREALAGDASFRRYERIFLGDRKAVLMDAPPPEEDVRPFLGIARHLHALGYSAPGILHEDVASGLLLLEDFGAGTFTRLLEDGHDEAPLYRLAVDVLVDLHRRPASEVIPDGLPPYDDARFLAEAALLVDWYAEAALGAPLPAAAARDYAELWRSALAQARNVPDTLVLRDYHVDNLMLVEGRDGVAACGVLDFQDAVAGPVTYDLVSLIEDARRDIDASIIAMVRTRYLGAFPALDRDAFDTSMAILGAQRHAKVIGIFTRLCRRDGKPDYLRHIPRVWRLLEGALGHPCLADLRTWFAIHFPGDRRIVPKVVPR